MKKIAFENGEMKGIRQTAKALKENGANINLIMKSTGLTRQEIDRI